MNLSSNELPRVGSEERFHIATRDLKTLLRLEKLLNSIVSDLLRDEEMMELPKFREPCTF